MNIQTSIAQPRSGSRPVRRDQLRQEAVSDVYSRTGKPREPAYCTHCGAVFHAGRWQWGERKADSAKVDCPSCQRIRDNYPAAFLYIGGAFLVLRHHEILRLIQHHAEQERKGHPLSRIISIKNIPDGAEAGNDDEGILVTTTDMHLARDLGEALHHAYQGNLTFHYSNTDPLLRVYWQR